MNGLSGDPKLNILWGENFNIYDPISCLDITLGLQGVEAHGISRTSQVG
jgi:hypothetical protein